MDKNIKLLGDKVLSDDIKRVLVVLAKDNSYILEVWYNSDFRYIVVDNKKQIVAETTDEEEATKAWFSVSKKEIDYKQHTKLYMREGEPLSWYNTYISLSEQRLKHGVAVVDVFVDRTKSTLRITYSDDEGTIYVTHDLKNEIIKATDRNNPIYNKEQIEKTLSDFHDRCSFIGNLSCSASCENKDLYKHVDEIISLALSYTKINYDLPKKTSGITLGNIIGLFDPNRSDWITFCDSFSNPLWSGYLTDIPKNYLDISNFDISFSDYGNWVVTI